MYGNGCDFEVSVDHGISVPPLMVRFLDLPVGRLLFTLASPIAADILDIGLAVQVADKLCPRGKRTKHQPYGYWARRIDVKLSVRFPEIWGQSSNRGRLEQLLSFLTDDDWNFDFVRRSDGGRPQESSVQQSLLPAGLLKRPGVTLFSGGVDSTYGLHLLRRSRHDVIFPLTVTNNGRISGLRDRVLNAMMANRQSDPNIRPVTTSMQVTRRDGSIPGGVKLEDSARGRAVQFIFAGAALAINCGGNALYVSENGYGAIGLPMTSDHFGSRATKAMHPKTLAMTADLVSMVSGRMFSVQNPGFGLTKGEMIRELVADPLGRNALEQTATCDRKVYRGLLQGCGVCTSCLLRHAGFKATSVMDPIKYDVPPSLDSNGPYNGGVALGYQNWVLRENPQYPESRGSIGGRIPPDSKRARIRSGARRLPFNASSPHS
jgi:7-cyano-7-deazaguanine synthase in queuosine biosynthesis